MTPNRTPLPWKIDGGKGKDGDLYIWPDGDYIGGHAIATVHGEIQEGAIGNAAFIVRACNSHEQLLAALKETQDAWRKTGQPVNKIWELGNAAIKKAEKGE